MAKRTTGDASDFLPAERDLEHLSAAVHACRGCELYERATQAVFGHGPAGADVMVVGEQPGDKEDREGLPFVGPAGRVLDKALEAAGIDRSRVYVTNAVKHFNWTETAGKRRMHKKPSARAVSACRPWLEAEIAAVHPRLIVLMGATAAQSLLGSSFRVTQHRGEVIVSGVRPDMLATVHPSSILRAPTDEERHAAMDEFVADLKAAAQHLKRE